VAAEPSTSEVSADLISLHLLDPLQGHPVQTWNFDRLSTVQIGRLEGSDVMLVDPVVSRLHATVRHIDGRWILESHGKHGVLVNDRRVETIDLSHEMVFRLGPKGPMLMFVEIGRTEQVDSQHGRATIEIDSRLIETLRIDQERA